MPENNNEFKLEMTLPDSARIDTVEQTAPVEARPESAGQIMRFPEVQALTPEMEEFLHSLPLTEDQKVMVDAAKGDTNKLFESWLEIRHIYLPDHTAQEVAKIIRGRIPAFLKEIRKHLESQAKTEALQRLDAALQKVQASQSEIAPVTTPPVPEATATPTTAPVQTTLEAAPETVTANLYGIVLDKLKSMEKEQEPGLKTVAEMEAALDDAKIKAGERPGDKYVGRTDNKRLTELVGTFVRMDGNMIDAAYIMYPSDVERDANGAPRWILKDNKVVGFYVNDMGTRMKAHRLLSGGAQTFTVDLPNNKSAWEIAGKLQEYLQRLRKDFTSADHPRLDIAINRGTNQLVVRRQVAKNATV